MTLPPDPAPSLAAGAADPGLAPGGLTCTQARVSPCAVCATAPCCRYLPLESFEVREFAQLDYAGYLLNFENIVLGLSAEGVWHIYYRRACRFLDRRDHTCTLHDQPEQPSICVHYNPYSCFYKTAFAGARADSLLLDRPRLAALTELLGFDENRALVQAPDWDTLCAAVREIPYAEPPEATRLVEDEAVARIDPADPADGGPPAAPPPPLRTLEEASNPCTGCRAHCCKVLPFGISVPSTLTHFDYLRFCLGFPGVELGVADSGWTLLVHTRCRHLEDDRCGVYGRPERPFVCRYYDALQCTYKPSFERPRAAGLVRLDLEALRRLTAVLPFDDQGVLLAPLPAAAVRSFLDTGDAGAPARGPAPSLFGLPA